MKTRVLFGVLTLAAVASAEWFSLSHVTAQTPSLPIFEVDPNWPKVPERWKLGDPSSFAIDA